MNGFEELDNRWLAIQVRSGWELRTAAGLRERGYEEFVPLYQRKRKWSDRTKIVEAPLFTGYVFIRFDTRIRQSIISAPGVIRFVGANNIPIAIDDTEIEALQRISKAAVAHGPCGFLQMGQEVEIKNGSLAGLRGKVVRFKNQQRLVISVSLLQKSVFVELDGFDVANVASGPATAAAWRSHDQQCAVGNFSA